MNIRKVLLDYTTGPSSLASCVIQWLWRVNKQGIEVKAFLWCYLLVLVFRNLLLFVWRFSLVTMVSSHWWTLSSINLIPSLKPTMIMTMSAYVTYITFLVQFVIGWFSLNKSGIAFFETATVPLMKKAAPQNVFGVWNYNKGTFYINTS